MHTALFPLCEQTGTSNMIGATRAFTASRLPSSLLLRARRAVNMACKAEVHLDFNTNAFEKELVDFAGTKEYIVKGGRDKFTSLPKAFEGVSEVRAQFFPCLDTVLDKLRVYLNTLYDFYIQHHGASERKWWLSARTAPPRGLRISAVADLCIRLCTGLTFWMCWVRPGPLSHSADVCADHTPLNLTLADSQKAIHATIASCILTGRRVWANPMSSTTKLCRQWEGTTGGMAAGAIRLPLLVKSSCQSLSSPGTWDLAASCFIFPF